MAAIGRRALLAGASIIGLGTATGVILLRSRNPDAASEVTKFLAAVDDDYRSGRVMVVGGWILSQAEVDFAGLQADAKT